MRGKLGGKLIVGVRALFVFLGDEMGKGLLSGLSCGRECDERAKRDDSARGGCIFAGEGAGESRFVDVEFLGNFF